MRCRSSRPLGEIPFAVASCAGFATLFAGLSCSGLRIRRTPRRFPVSPSKLTALEMPVGSWPRMTSSFPSASPRSCRWRFEVERASAWLAERFIAKSTVDTHLRRIYGKCGVHSRQELIDLGELESQALLSGKESAICMVNETLLETLRGIVGSQAVRKDVPMSGLTTFQIGGPAAVVVEPSCVQEAANVLEPLVMKRANLCVCWAWAATCLWLIPACPRSSCDSPSDFRVSPWKVPA